MSFSIAPLLVHSQAVPAEAREALRAAAAAPPDQRKVALESAARTLYRHTDLECGDVRDLFGLSSETCA
jgi:plasmid stability protein